MGAALGGFGGIAGVGGVCFIIAADLIDIMSTVVTQIMWNNNVLQYLSFIITSLFGSYCFFFGFVFFLFFNLLNFIFNYCLKDLVVYWIICIINKEKMNLKLGNVNLNVGFHFMNIAMKFY